MIFSDYFFLLTSPGINIVTYYAPTLLKSSLGMTQERALFISCFLQVWYIIASLLTVHPPFYFMLRLSY